MVFKSSRRDDFSRPRQANYLAPAVLPARYQQRAKGPTRSYPVRIIFLILFSYLNFLLNGITKGIKNVIRIEKSRPSMKRGGYRLISDLRAGEKDSSAIRTYGTGLTRRSPEEAAGQRSQIRDPKARPAERFLR